MSHPLKRGMVDDTIRDFWNEQTIIIMQKIG